jgi:exopolyphosphatase/guanosine-5'-triphosphate,3'-diphosphate pyrophosphatase
VAEPNPLRNALAPTAVKLHLGVIDVGSNALRIQVARVYEDGTFCVIHDEREPVRLGEEVFRTGKLSDSATQRAMQTLARFKGVAEKHQVSQLRAVATSALREARNGEAFLSAVRAQTGFAIEVISGEKEAELIARGVLTGFRAPTRRVALVDVGGGSTEITVVDDGKVAYCGSLPLGSARLTEMFCHTDPLSSFDERRLRLHARRHLAAVTDWSALPPCPVVLGSAGTIGALANYIRRRPSADRNGSRARATFTTRELQRACAELRRMDLGARRQLPGIEERRSEIIVAGAVLLEEICRQLKARSVRVVRRGLRDGLMLEEIGRLGFANPKGPLSETAASALAGEPAPARTRGEA